MSPRRWCALTFPWICMSFIAAAIAAWSSMGSAAMNLLTGRRPDDVR
jgi:hypothetical protein